VGSRGCCGRIISGCAVRGRSVRGAGAEAVFPLENIPFGFRRSIRINRTDRPSCRQHRDVIATTLPEGISRGAIPKSAGRSQVAGHYLRAIGNPARPCRRDLVARPQAAGTKFRPYALINPQLM